MNKWTMGLVALAMLAAAPAQAITVGEVKGLALAGAGDTVILSKIEADDTIFRLTVDEILELKEAGVSDAVLTYMINTGKLDGRQDEGSSYEPPTGESSQGENTYLPAEDDYVTDTQGQYATGVDSQYRSSINVSLGFGYYYPHWPGYWWASYYDPFWWPRWSFYWYWPPYPYYYCYYDPWYYGRPASCYNYYGCYNSGYYSRAYQSGRYVGNRGVGGQASRTYKSENTAAGYGKSSSRAAAGRGASSRGNVYGDGNRVYRTGKAGRSGKTPTPTLTNRRTGSKTPPARGETKVQPTPTRVNKGHRIKPSPTQSPPSRVYRGSSSTGRSSSGGSRGGASGGGSRGGGSGGGSRSGGGGGRSGRR